MNIYSIARRGTVIASLAFAFSAHAQLEMGGWQTHFSYRGIDQLEQTKNKIYAVSSGNLFSVDKEYNSIEQYSKINGLTDSNIKQIAYDDKNDVLVICYSDFNIDLIKDGVTNRITDIATKEISGKTLNNISFNGNFIYLSCGFGIVTINIKKMEIASTYIIGENHTYLSVLQTAFSGDSIYALTSSKLYAASLKDNNLANDQHWKSYSLPDNKPLTIASFNGTINLFGNSWYQWSDSGWVASAFTTMTQIDKVHTTDDKLVIVSSGKFATIFNKDYSIDSLVFRDLNDMVFDERNGKIWYAQDSLIEEDKDLHQQINAYLPDGPYSNTTYFMKYDQNEIISGSGNEWNAPAIVQEFKDNKWSYFDNSSILANTGNSSFKAIWDATHDVTDPKRLYVGTWYSIFEFYDNQFVKQYTIDETGFGQSSGTTQIEKVLTTKDGYLWVINTNGGNTLRCRDNDGNWHELNCSAIANLLRCTDFIITKKDNYKIIASDLYESTGKACLHVVKSGSYPYLISNQRNFTSFPTNDGTVTPTKVMCVTEDNNGEIWVGTDVGPIILKNTGNIFNSSYTASRIKITRKDDATLADYLLSTELIKAIAVDGANRKWIGTYNSGVYLLSEDGQKTIHHFTKDNSPLTTNSISKIAIDPTSGMVYIATPDGLFSYKSDAADGKENFDNVHVYPNPIRPDYDGEITITGLMEDTEVRITDLEGHVVSHGKSNGSVYTWDGILANGHRASTGVYFVFQATQDGNNANVTKFAIVKR